MAGAPACGDDDDAPPSPAPPSLAASPARFGVLAAYCACSFLCAAWRAPARTRACDGLEATAPSAVVNEQQSLRAGGCAAPYAPPREVLLGMGRRGARFALRGARCTLRSVGAAPRTWAPTRRARRARRLWHALP